MALSEAKCEALSEMWTTLLYMFHCYDTTGTQHSCHQLVKIHLGAQISVLNFDNCMGAVAPNAPFGYGYSTSVLPRHSLQPPLQNRWCRLKCTHFTIKFRKLGQRPTAPLPRLHPKPTLWNSRLHLWLKCIDFNVKLGTVTYFQISHLSAFSLLRLLCMDPMFTRPRGQVYLTTRQSLSTSTSSWSETAKPSTGFTGLNTYFPDFSPIFPQFLDVSQPSLISCFFSQYFFL